MDLTGLTEKKFRIDKAISSIYLTFFIPVVLLNHKKRPLLYLEGEQFRNDTAYSVELKLSLFFDLQELNWIIKRYECDIRVRRVQKFIPSFV